MAITSGQGNPRWNRDETILALDLYLKVRPALPAGSDSRVIELSNFLRSLPIHPLESRKENFRNPDSVAFKLQNLKAVETGGSGLSNSSQMDKKIWAELSGNPQYVSILADAIRNAVNLPVSLEAKDFDDTDEEIEFKEGKLLFRLHRTRERKSSLRKTILKRAIDSLDGLKCSTCDAKPDENLESASDAIFEVHHILPLSEIGEGRTKVSDVSILCANCHRLIHRLSSMQSKWLSIADFRSKINKF